HDDETQLSYHKARYLDPMLGVWISVDPKRFFPSPYLYMGNGYNPIRFADLNGQEPGDVYVFNSDGEKFGNFIAKLHRGQGPGFSHAAIETKDGRLFSADEDGVGVKDKSIALKGRTGVILRPKQKLNIDAMQKFIDDAQGGVYLVNGVCSSNVVDALEAGGLKLREDWTHLELIKDPSKIKKTVPHPAVLLEYPELEQVDYFREEPNDLKDAN
ncbi:RHS repeat-associated core domain-containing protein, partial [Fibrobacter sp. UWCM]|uniref:RHS repeat domain-containing protein n=1 Tax=Fibrobacter sp. UWCM TaxID=1896208 RepID=UPI00092305AE